MLQRSQDIILSDNLDELLQTHRSENKQWLCMLYCRKGSMQVRIDDTLFQVRANDAACCLPSFLLGEYMRTPDFESDILCVSMTFYRDVAHECFREVPQWIEKQDYLSRHPVRTLDACQRELLTSYLRLLQIYMQCPPTPYRPEITRAIARAATLEVMSILEPDKHNTDDNTEKTNERNDAAVRAFFLLLKRENYTLQPVQWYAAQLHLTPKYLSALCRLRTGKNASQWIRDFTLREAKRRLMHSDDNVKEIAFQLGFADSSAFCQYIRKHTRQTPAELRKQLRTGL